MITQDAKQVDTKSFGNRDTTRQVMSSRLRDASPEWISEEVISSLTDAAVHGHEDVIDSYSKNSQRFIYLSNPLPEWTQWEDLKILIRSYSESNPGKSRVSIFLKNKEIRNTNFREMHLEDSVLQKVSVSWRILLFLALGAQFFWDDGVMPEKYRKEKSRLSRDLKNLFWLSADPYIRKGKKCELRLSLAVVDQNYLCVQHPVKDKIVFDLIDDYPITF